MTKVRALYQTPEVTDALMRIKEMKRNGGTLPGYQSYAEAILPEGETLVDGKIYSYPSHAAATAGAEVALGQIFTPNGNPEFARKQVVEEAAILKTAAFESGNAELMAYALGMEAAVAESRKGLSLSGAHKVGLFAQPLLHRYGYGKSQFARDIAMQMLVTSAGSYAKLENQMAAIQNGLADMSLQQQQEAIKAILIVNDKLAAEGQDGPVSQSKVERILVDELGKEYTLAKGTFDAVTDTMQWGLFDHELRGAAENYQKKGGRIKVFQKDDAGTHEIPEPTLQAA